jgi:ABC-2 type transport system permease protein
VTAAPPARGRAGSRIAAHAAWETRLLMRNGEQLLLTLVIPVVILLVLALTDILVPADATERLPRALATVLSVSVVSAAFASLAIATGFERRSGVLRFLGTTPLSRSELLAGKFAATAVVTLLSAGVVTAVAVALGWRPSPGAAWALPVLLLGTATFAAWGMALAGLLRAEAVLAVANGIFLALLMFGGIVIPASALPGPMSALVGWLPSGALVDALTAALVHGGAPSASSVLVLVAWLIAGATLSARTFRWS